MQDAMQESVEHWGQEYLRNIAGEIGEEYHLALRKDTDPSKELLDLVAQIVPYHMTHNSGKSDRIIPASIFLSNRPCFPLATSMRIVMVSSKEGAASCVLTARLSCRA